MREERARILALLRERKITVDEAEQLLDALGPAGERTGQPGERPPGRARPRRLCIRITDLRTGKVKTNVRLPVGAWGLLSKLTRTRLGRRMGGLALQDIQRAAREGGTGHIVDVTDGDDGERVEIFFE
jgi:hypothetical protein